MGSGLGGLLLGGLVIPDVPEAKSLIGSSRADLSTIGRDGHVEHTLRVSGELGNTSHGGVLPEGKLILRKAVATEDLLLCWAPHQRTNLTTSINLVNTGASHGVVESNVSVSSAGTSGKDVSFPGAPCQSFHGSVGFGEGVTGS